LFSLWWPWMFLDFYGNYFQWSSWLHPICFYVYIICLSGRWWVTFFTVLSTFVFIIVSAWHFCTPSAFAKFIQLQLTYIFQETIFRWKRSCSVTLFKTNEVRKKIIHCRRLYVDLPDPIVLMSIAVNTSGPLYHDFFSPYTLILRLVLCPENCPKNPISFIFLALPGWSPEGICWFDFSQMPSLLHFELSTRPFTPLPRVWGFHLFQLYLLVSNYTEPPIFIFPNNFVSNPKKKEHDETECQIIPEL